ncbi:MAG: hypothetical protein ACNI25_03915 [Halarcobacter sp.]
MFTSLVSGTVSEISGGKFANGAVTGAFVHLFNNWGAVLSQGTKMKTKSEVNEQLNNIHDGGRRIITSSLAGMAAGAVKGALSASIVPGAGTIVEAFVGGTVGFTIELEVSGWGRPIEEGLEIMINTGKGYYELKK